MVIAAHVQHLITLTFVPPVADAIGSMSHFAEVGEFLGIQVEEIPRCLVFVAIGRLFLPEGGGLGRAGLAQPEPHRGPGNSQLCCDPDGRLAPPPSTYGLDDEAKLMASRQTKGPAGIILQTGNPFGLESCQPDIGAPSADPNGFRCCPDGPTLLQDPLC